MDHHIMMTNDGYVLFHL